MIRFFTRIIFFGLFGLAANSALGQVNYTIHEVTGVVVDSLTAEPLSGALVTVINRAGSFHQVADRAGKFSLNMVKDGDAIKIEVAFLGYRLFQKYVPANRKKIDAGTIQMVTDPQEIDAIVVKGRQLLFNQNGDTLIYFPSNLYMREGSSALDILKKMPGVKVENGDVEVQGQRVERTYVNGRLIFGKDNPLHALNYLEAKDISRVLAYDEYDEQSALLHGKHGRKRRVINLLTFNLFDQSFNINTLAGIGADLRENEEGKHRTRYMLGTDMAFFKEGQSIVADYSLQNSLGIEPGGVPAYKLYSGGNTGYERQQAAHLEYSGKLFPKWDITGKYGYNDNYSRGNNIQQDQYFGDGADFARTYYDSLISRAQSDVHQAYIKLEHIGTRAITTINGSMNARKNLSSNHSSNQIDLEEQVFSRISNDIQSQRQALGFNLNAQVSVKVGKGTLRTALSGELSDTDSDGERKEDSLARIGNKFILTTGTGRSRDLSGEVAYNLNFAEAGSFSLGYKAAYHYGKERTMATNTYSGEIDSTLTRNYTNDYLSNSLMTGYSLSKGKWYLNAGVRFEHKTLGRDDAFPEHSRIDKVFKAALPSLSVRYAFGILNSISLSYSTSGETPSLEMLRDKLDYENPLYLTTGNPNLKQGYTHNVNIQYSKSNIEKQIFWSVGFSATVTNNTIGTKRTLFTEGVYLPQYDYTTTPGATLTSFENVGSATHLSTFFSYDIPINFLKCRGGISGAYSFDQLPMYAGDAKIDRTQHKPSLSLSLESNFSDKLEFKITNHVVYLFSKGTEGTLERSLNNTTFCNVSADFLKRMFGDILYTFYTDHSYTEKSDRISNHLLNATLGVRFMKDRKGSLSFTAYDLLNNNKSFTSKVFADRISNIWSYRSAGFFLFTFTYKFGQLK